MVTHRKHKAKVKTTSLGIVKKGLWGCFWVGLILLAVLYTTQQRLIVSKFEGRKWQLPSHVYARPLELYSGVYQSMKDLIWELKQLGYRNDTSVSRVGQYAVKGSQLTVFTRGFEFWDGEDKPQRVVIQFQNDYITRIADENQAMVANLRIEPLRIGGIYLRQPEDRRLLTLEQMPSVLVDSLIAVEDREFYQHHGVSIKAIVRALIANLKRGRVTQGGSTITQQLVKNFFLNSQRTLVRKGREALMAVILELHYQKNEILQTYLNEIYFGQAGRRAIHGIGLASDYFFKQPLTELSIEQVALLIGLIKGPHYYDPWKHSERALKRRNLVLKIMHAEGIISQEMYQEAVTLRLGVSKRSTNRLNPYSAFMGLLIDELHNSYQIADLKTRGLRFYTSLDPQIQHHLQLRAQQRIQQLETQYKMDEGKLQTAVVITQIGTGEIVAILGDRDPNADGFNRAINARRPIGSLIKPFTYLAALQNSAQYQLSTLLDDTEFSINAPDQTVWSPKNYDKKTHGKVPLYRALAKSFNLSSARLGLNIGLDAVAGTIENLGVHREIKQYPSMLLGSSALTPLDVATAYHTIANDGFYTPLRGVRGVYTSQGEPLTRHVQNIERRVDSGSIYLLKYAMQQVFAIGTAKNVYRTLNRQLSFAGKTGTTDDLRDSWIVGFGGSYSTLVWLGRDDNKMTPLTSTSGALAVWQSIMGKIEKRPVDMIQPNNVKYFWIDERQETLSLPKCPNTVYLPFIEGTQPKVNNYDCRTIRAVGNNTMKKTTTKRRLQNPQPVLTQSHNAENHLGGKIIL